MNYKKMILIIMFIPFISIAQNEKWVFMGYWTYENIPGKCSKKSDYGLIKIRKNANYSKNLSSVKKRLKDNYPTLSGITFYETTASKGGVYKVYKINSWCTQNSKTYNWTGYHVLAGDNTIDDRFNNYVNSISNVKSTQTYITGFLDLEINGAEDEVFAIQGISMAGIGSKLNESNDKSNASEDVEKDQIAEFPNESEKEESESKEETRNGESYFIDERDGSKYKILTFNSNGKTITWMAENLNYKTDGSYNKEETDGKGRFYEWSVAKNSCPNGWRLPNDDDWDKLINNFGGYQGTSNKFKSIDGWSNDGNGTNESGFNSFPTGIYYVIKDKIEGLGEGNAYWASNIVFERNAKIRRFHYQSPDVINSNLRFGDYTYRKVPHKLALCVRCVKSD